MIPVSSWKAMKDCSSGVVRTPPKSEIDRLRMLSHRRGPPRSGRAPRAPRPTSGRRRSRRRGPARLTETGADQRAGAAQRLPVLGVGPELQRRPPLHAVGAVLGREQRLSKTSTGAPSGSQSTAATCSSPCSPSAGGRTAVSASSPPSEKTMPIDRRRICPESLIGRQPIAPPPGMSPVDDPRRRPQTGRRRLRGDLRAPRRGERRPPSRSGRRARTRWRRGSRSRRRPIPGSSPSAGERWSATPMPVRTASARPTAGRRRLRLRRRRAARPRASAAASTRPSSSACAAALRTSPAPASPCRTRPASPCTSSLGFVPVGVYRADRLEGRGLARRRLVAAGAGAGER